MTITFCQNSLFKTLFENFAQNEEPARPEDRRNKSFSCIKTTFFEFSPFIGNSIGGEIKRNVVQSDVKVTGAVENKKKLAASWKELKPNTM